MPEEEKQGPQQVTFPFININVGTNGIVIETFFSSMISVKQALNEQQTNAIFSEWLKTRQQVQAQQQLIKDVMRNKLH